MNASIEKRIKIVVFTALSLVVLMGVVTLYYFTQINTNITTMIGNDIQVERYGQQLKSLHYEIRSIEREYLYFLRTGIQTNAENPAGQRLLKKLQSFSEVLQKENKLVLPESYTQQLEQLSTNVKLYQKNVLSSIKEDLSRKQIDDLAQNLYSLRESQDKIISKLMNLGSQDYLMHQNFMDHLISDANRNLVLLVLIAICSALLIIYLAPKNVTRPIRMYLNAIQELRELKFETRLPVTGKNELCQLGDEINKFIDAFVNFDEMKLKKIQFEKRKFKVISDILNLGVVLISIEGEVLFLNAQMAKFLRLDTESFQKKDFHFVRLPDEIKELFEDAISKKEKFENRMVILTYEKEDEEGSHDEAVELLVDAGMVRNYIGDVANIILTFEDISDKPEDSIFKRISYANKPMV